MGVRLHLRHRWCCWHFVGCGRWGVLCGCLGVVCCRSLAASKYVRQPLQNLDFLGAVARTSLVRAEQCGTSILLTNRGTQRHGNWDTTPKFLRCTPVGACARNCMFIHEISLIFSPAKLCFTAWKNPLFHKALVYKYHWKAGEGPEKKNYQLG